MGLGSQAPFASVVLWGERIASDLSTKVAEGAFPIGGAVAGSRVVGPVGQAARDRR